MDLITFAKRFIAIFLLFFILVAYMVAPAFQPDAGDGSITPFKDPDNSSADWKRCTQFWKMLEDEGQVDFELYTLVGSPTVLRDIEEPEKTLYIAIGVEKEYKPAEVDILKQFYDDGGKIIIADDHNLANSFSQEFEVNYFGQTFWDIDFEINNSFPRVHAFIDFEEYVLVMNQPTGLWTRPNVTELTTLANGSKDSFVDRNGNHIVDIYDAQGFIPVIMQYQKEGDEGKIIFISDPGIFIDDMIDRGGMNASGLEFNNNKAFLRALIVNKLLPTGGKVIFDESRHEQDKFTKPVYGTIEAITILTSNFREMGLLLSGMVLILTMVIYRAKEKEDWIHKYDIGTIKRRADVPDSRREIKDRMKAAVLRKLRMINQLSPEELQALTQTQLASMIKDHEINELVLNEEIEFTNEELQLLTEKLRRWEK